MKADCGLEAPENETILCPWERALIALTQPFPPDFSTLCPWDWGNLPRGSDFVGATSLARAADEIPRNEGIL